MTLAACGVAYWPRPLVNASVISYTFGNNALTFDSDTDRLAWVGRSPVADTIASVSFRTNTVTTGTNVTLKVQIESVTNGKPSGTIIAAGASGTVAMADSDDNLWKTVTIGTPPTVSVGTEFAIVITKDSGAATPNIQFSVGNTSISEFQGQYPSVLQDTGTGSWTAPGSWLPMKWIVQMTTAGIVPIAGLIPNDGATIVTAFNSGSTPDEQAAKLTVPFKCRAVGIRAFLCNIAAGADFTFLLYNSGGTTLASASEDGDFPFSTTQDGYVDLWFTPVELDPGTYRASVRPDTANSLSIVTLTHAGTSQPANSINAMPVPAGGCVLSTRTDAGAWTDTTTTFPLISLIIDQLDNGAGGGGGNANILGGSVIA